MVDWARVGLRLDVSCQAAIGICVHTVDMAFEGVEGEASGGCDDNGTASARIVILLYMRSALNKAAILYIYVV